MPLDQRQVDTPSAGLIGKEGPSYPAVPNLQDISRNEIAKILSKRILDIRPKW